MREAVMATRVQKLSFGDGDQIEVDGRLYDVIASPSGGLGLEPAITKTADELMRERGGRSLTEQEFEELFGHLPTDGEG